MGTTALIVYLMSLDGCQAAGPASVLAGARWTRRHVRATARRESRCRPISIHARDEWAADTMVRKARKVDWLHDCHDYPNISYAVRGAHGLSGAYSMRFLQDCAPPWVLDVPWASGVVASRRMDAGCKGDKTRDCVRALWAGRRNYKERPR